MIIGPTLVNATDIATWAASRRDSEAILPRLVRRLIRASGADLRRLAFATDEGVQLGGWDGIVVAVTGNEAVPDGQSGWELSTRRDQKGKADEDYEKRTSAPDELVPAETTYVCLTGRRWSTKDKWARERSREGIWRDVRAYDAEDLAAWLEGAPAVHVWFSILLGKHLAGLRDFSHAWTLWSQSTTPELIPELVIGGRDQYVERIHTWLQQPASPLALQADSPEEAIAFFLAAVEMLSEEERLSVASRGLIVDDPYAWASATSSSQALILVPTFEDRSGVAQALRQGNHVFLPLGREDSNLSEVVALPRLSRAVAEKAFEQMGVSSDTARDLATLARRSLMSLRRKLSVVPAVQRPRWSAPSNARSVVPAMLVGTWNDRTHGDREAIAQLAGTTYEEYAQELMRWVNESDPPLRRVGDAWLFVSKEDAWRLLAKYLTPQDLSRFEAIVFQALGTYDPAFDLPAERRYMAGILGYSSRYSGLLQKGLADTLALMGALGEAIRIGEAATVRDSATSTVRRLLERANSDWRLWASLEHVLPLLAEAAPQEFLDAVDNGLRGDEPVIMNVFRENDEGILGPRSCHSGLLWALETLAWSSDYLGRATLILSKLARLDPGGRLSNRPANSLREIFLLWRPQTSATHERRQQVLEAICQREPEVGWTLLCKLIPESQGFAIPTSKPHWRDWVPEGEPTTTWAEIWKATSDIVDRLLSLVDYDGARWVSLIQRIDDLPKESHEAVVERLEASRISQYARTDRLAIWNALRGVVSKHMGFADADWALPAEYVDRLERVYKRFEPKDPLDKYQWLFADHPAVTRPKEDDWEKQFKRLSNERTRALRTVYRKLGLSGIRAMLTRVARPYDLGLTLGRSGILTSEEEDELLCSLLGDTDPRHSEFVHPVVFWRFSSRGWDWAQPKLDNLDWTPEQRSAFFASLPPSSEVWNRVEEGGPDVERLYWKRVRTFFGIEGAADAIRIVERLLKYGRPYTALDNILMYSHRHEGFPPTLIVEVLEKAARTNPADDRSDMQALGHHIGELLDQIEASGEVPEDRIAKLEWLYLPLFRHRSERKPKILHRELERNPDFFAEIVCYAYKAEGEQERQLSEEEAARAQLAYELLEGWCSVPGTREDGTIDGTVLREWVVKAREVVRARGRRVGDNLVGQTLRYSPPDEEGIWPAIPVRSLIEELESESLEHGIEIEVYNSRGVTSRDPTDGGVQERAIAERYASYAKAVADHWPRTGAMLRRIAEMYERDARREDTSAELTEDLW